MDKSFTYNNKEFLYVPKMVDIRYKWASPYIYERDPDKVLYNFFKEISETKIGFELMLKYNIKFFNVGEIPVKHLILDDKEGEEFDG